MKQTGIGPKVVVERWVWLRPGLHGGRGCFCCKFYKAKAAALKSRGVL